MSAKSSLPFEIKDVDPKLAAELMKQFTGEKTGYILVGPKKYFFPHKFKQMAPKIYNMPLKSTDVFVASYPRSGTTWTQELVWMVANDLDYEKSNKVPLTERYLFLEFSMFIHPEVYKELYEENKHNKENIKLLEKVSKAKCDNLADLPSPRFLKTHLPLSLLPPELLDVAKMVYVARDPRDSAVSFYHLNRTIRFHCYTGDFKTFWNYFIKGLQFWTPYFEHLKEAWEKRNHPNMLFLFYEELSNDLPAAVHKVSNFFNKRYTEEQVMRLCDHLNFDNFKNNKSITTNDLKILGIAEPEATFVRKGKVGGWRDYFDEEMMQQAEKWINDNLKDTDLRFPHLIIENEYLSARLVEVCGDPRAGSYLGQRISLAIQRGNADSILGTLPCGESDEFHEIYRLYERQIELAPN